MKIILSPARKMNLETDCFLHEQLPQFIPEAQEILDQLQSMTDQQLQDMWGCNDKLASKNIHYIRTMELTRNLAPALFSYEGIAFRYLAANILETTQLDYLRENLRILSGFYGVLCPFDGVSPYRLEMQSKFAPPPHSNLYQFWGDKWANVLVDGDQAILNLASHAYSKAVRAHLPKNVPFVGCAFGELKEGRVVEKGTICKMSRGQMVRWLAERKVSRLEEVKEFTELGFQFSEERSTPNLMVFLK
ncbi:MAG: peroxide stress protein YaaA [Eubacteriales bacterium]